MTINQILRIGGYGVSFRACMFCHSIRVYPYLGFMTGQQYQCQDCEEIMVMTLEFEEIEDYLEFLKIQSPEKFAKIQNDNNEE